MKSSGKTRTLNLITSIAWNGNTIGSPTEAVLFRSAGKGTMGIDEFEGINRKENAPLREFLNAGYKDGMVIRRLRKKKTAEGEIQELEEFNAYTPIVMANIYGMEEVLGTRCIPIVLERSNNPIYVKTLEDFKDSFQVQEIKNKLKILENYDLVQLCSLCSQKKVYILWNQWIKRRYSDITTLLPLTTLTTLTTLDLDLDSFFLTIDKTDLTGRDLELYFPLFLVAKAISNDIFLEISEIAKKSTKEAKTNEMMESKDVMLFDFVSRLYPNQNYSIKELTTQFRTFVDYENIEEMNWLSTKWMGRALKRLNLIIDKRRIAKGIEVTLNIEKAEQKLSMFK